MPRLRKQYPVWRLLLVVMLCAGGARAHYTWVEPVTRPLVVGEKVLVRIGHGHKFPQSEERINTSGVEFYVLDAAGKKTKLTFAVLSPAPAATFRVREAGLYRFVMVDDGGVRSRTPEGLKPGGRQQNPGATQASRRVRTAVAYAATSRETAPDGKPVGLDFELAAARREGAWELVLLKRGAPVAGAKIEFLAAGAAQAVEAGTTGSDGRLRFSARAGASGAGLFVATLREEAPAGADYDFTLYETSLFVSW